MSSSDDGASDDDDGDAYGAAAAKRGLHQTRDEQLYGVFLDGDGDHVKLPPMVLGGALRFSVQMKYVELACRYYSSVGYDGYLQVTIDGTAVAPVVRLDPDSKVVVGYDDAAEETTCSTADVARAFDECVGERAPAVDRRITLAPVSEQYRLRNRR